MTGWGDGATARAVMAQLIGPCAAMAKATAEAALAAAPTTAAVDSDCKGAAAEV